MGIYNIYTVYTSISSPTALEGNDRVRENDGHNEALVTASVFCVFLSFLCKHIFYWHAVNDIVLCDKVLWKVL
jgi:hypothetical protein